MPPAASNSGPSVPLPDAVPELEKAYDIIDGGFKAPCGGHNTQMIRTMPKLPSRFYEQGSEAQVDGKLKKYKPLRKDRKYVGVEGKWYDVTNFCDRHPGGNIILEYVNRDSSCVFWCFHAPEVLKNWKPAGVYNELDLNTALNDPAEHEFRKLTKRFRSEGWYDPNYFWLARKFFWVAFCFYATYYLLYNCEGWRYYFLGCVTMAGFWQQSGFLMHDFMHNSFFQNRSLDQAFGIFFGTFCFGISSFWWRDEHFEHHVFTNTYVENVGPADPQMKEDTWIQDQHLSPFKLNEDTWQGRTYRNYLAPIQHLLYIPTNILLGRWAIAIDSYMEEKRAVQWFAIGLHYMWFIVLVHFCNIPTWYERIGWVYIAGCFQGVLHVQLLVSHYDKPFVEKQNTKHHSYMRRQAEAVKDVINPRWLDWFHGGLNFHLVHHLWPKLPRSRYRAADKLVREICDKHDIKVDRRHFFESQKDILTHLKAEGEKFVWAMKIGGAG